VLSDGAGLNAQLLYGVDFLANVMLQAPLISLKNRISSWPKPWNNIIMLVYFCQPDGNLVERIVLACLGGCVKHALFARDRSVAQLNQLASTIAGLTDGQLSTFCDGIESVLV
jgi:hypothetical protein